MIVLQKRRRLLHTSINLLWCCQILAVSLVLLLPVHVTCKANNRNPVVTTNHMATTSTTLFVGSNLRNIQLQNNDVSSLLLRRQQQHKQRNQLSTTTLVNSITRSPTGTMKNGIITTNKQKPFAFLPTFQTQLALRKQNLNQQLDVTTRKRNHSNQLQSSSSSSSSSTTQLNIWNNNNNDDDLIGADKLRACVPYIVPLLDGDKYGYYIYERIPILGYVDDIILGPLLHIYNIIPFCSVLVFIIITIGTRFSINTMDRTVRFNAQQAALLDILIIIPELLLGIPSEATNDAVKAGIALPRYILEPCSNFVYYCLVSSIVYCIYNNLNGKKPKQIPYITSFAEYMTGPF